MSDNENIKMTSLNQPFTNARTDLMIDAVWTIQYGPTNIMLRAPNESGSIQNWSECTPLVIGV